MYMILLAECYPLDRSPHLMIPNPLFSTWSDKFISRENSRLVTNDSSCNNNSGTYICYNSNLHIFVG